MRPSSAMMIRFIVVAVVVGSAKAQNTPVVLSPALSAAPTASPTSSPTAFSSTEGPIEEPGPDPTTKESTSAPTPAPTPVPTTAAPTDSDRVYKYGFSVYGLNYNPRQGPDWDPNKCKSSTQMFNDLAIFKDVTDNVRLYSVYECDQGRYVLEAAAQLNMGVWLGLWVSGISSESFDNDLAALKTLIAEGVVTEKSVLGIHVGSEVLYREEITLEQAISYMNTVKGELVANGLNIPVSIADIGDIYIEYPELMGAVDLAAVNGFPFWESVEVDRAAAYFATRIEPVVQQAVEAGNKEIVITETGWASGGYHEDTSEASPENQAKYFADFYCENEANYGWRVFWFAGLNADYLKDQYGSETVEAYFGVFNADGTIKDNFLSLQIRCQRRRKARATADE